MSQDLNRKKLQIYKDIDLKERVDPLRLGPVKVGEKQRFIYYVHNPTKAEFRGLKFSIADSEVSIIRAPNEIMPGKSAILEFEWAPSITIEKPLETNIQMHGECWYRPVGDMKKWTV